MMLDVARQSVSQKQAPDKLGNVLILGLGKSGKAAARYCVDLLGSRVDSVTITAEADEDARAFAESIAGEGVTVCFDVTTFSETYDLGIVSPGISEFSELYENARKACTQFVGELEFAWRESNKESSWVAVTGTNGKTTTTSLIAHLLKGCGFRAQAVGNIGDTCIEAVSKGETDIYVAEVSSYQLASTKDFAPNIALLLNITPDHISWHKTLDNYIAAKMKVFANMQKCPPLAQMGQIEPSPFLVMDGMCVSLGVDEGHECSHAAYIDDGCLTLKLGDCTEVLGRVEDLAIKGEHNKINALASVVAAYLLGADSACIARQLADFKPLEHRIEPCGSVSGVAFYNDSKATNVDAVIKALSAFPNTPPIILLGGKDKGTELDELVREVSSSCKVAVCYGEAGERFARALSHTSLEVFHEKGMNEAFYRAVQSAKEGDVVLLSPACASFDEFSSFNERGEVFKQLVAKQREVDQG